MSAWRMIWVVGNYEDGNREEDKSRDEPEARRGKAERDEYVTMPAKFHTRNCSPNLSSGFFF